VPAAEAGQVPRDPESHFHQNVDFMFIDDQVLEDQHAMTFKTKFD